MKNFTSSELADKQFKIIFVLALFLVCFFTSVIVPPFQSPDERDHIKRAYLLTKGKIILERSPDGMYSGGAIDSGLAAYIDAYEKFPFRPDIKLSSDELDDTNAVHWTGIEKFSPAPGTGYYFPIIYAPQAAGLAIGESLGMSISASYKLARLIALSAASLLLLVSFFIYAPSLVVLALLIIPMSIFQMSSASLDGISTAVSILAISAFLRIASDKANSKPWLLFLLSACVLVVASSRTHLLPLVLLVFATFFYTKNKNSLLAGGVVSLFLVVWLAIAIKTTVIPKVAIDLGLPTSGIVGYYLAHPLSLAKVLLATWTNPDLQKFYLESFFGMLGWLDARFANGVYTYLYLFLILILVSSVSFKTIRLEWPARALLVFCAAGSVFLVFFALLVTFTPHPATTIRGVQGRYFLVPVLLIAYALCSSQKIKPNRFQFIGAILLVALLLFTVNRTTDLLLTRYYVADEQPEMLTLKPSPPLTADIPIKLEMADRQKKKPQPLRRIGISFGTYVRRNPGTAELHLKADDGKTLEIPFDLPDLADNQYRFFDLDDLSYTSGKIVFATGGGVSVWEAHRNEGGIASSCLIYELSNGVKRFTKGCPRPY